MIDPLNLNIPLSGVETTFPLIPEGDYELDVTSSDINPNYDKSGHQWDLVFGLVNPTTSVDGRDVKAGTKVYPDWPLQLQVRTDGKGGTEWEGSAPQRGLASAIDAIFGTSKADRPAFTRETVDGAVGKRVVGHIVVDTDKNGVQRNKVLMARLKGAQ